MNRSQPLKRGSSGLARTRATKPKALKRPPMDPGLRQLVFIRAGGRCDCCGTPLDPIAWDAHHRQLRKRGGEDSLENLVALVHGHHMIVHQHPAEATERGLMVASWDDPAAVPVRRGDGHLYLPAGRRWQRVEETE